MGVHFWAKQNKHMLNKLALNPLGIIDSHLISRLKGQVRPVNTNVLFVETLQNLPIFAARMRADGVFSFQFYYSNLQNRFWLFYLI